jgi:hypothetical protein
VREVEDSLEAQWVEVDNVDERPKQAEERRAV